MSHLAYPPDRDYVHKEFRLRHDEALKDWWYEESFETDGNAMVLLSDPEIRANEARIRRDEPDYVDNPTCFTNIARSRIHFGFDNMWHLREPVYLLGDDNDVKIWWQPRDRHYREARAPEHYRFFGDAVSAKLFLKRLVLIFGPPPLEWPCAGQCMDGKEQWGAMLSKDNGNQIFLRVYNGRPQIAYNGTTWGMYESVEVLQLLMGPVGDAQYHERMGPQAYQPSLADELERTSFESLIELPARGESFTNMVHRSIPSIPVGLPFGMPTRIPNGIEENNSDRIAAAAAAAVPRAPVGFGKSTTNKEEEAYVNDSLEALDDLQRKARGTWKPPNQLRKQRPRSA